MVKAFICGIGGLVGSKLVNEMKEEFEVYGSYNLRNPKIKNIENYKIDITKFEKIKEILESVNPDVIINTTALNNVDYCETHKDEAKKINIDSVANLVNISDELGVKFVHISSDSVFDGLKKEPYLENDISNPPNYYGRTKLESEKITLNNSNNIVIRASVLYGWLPHNISSLNSSSMKSINFAQWLISQILKKQPVKIITDEISSPIIAEDLCESIKYIIKNDYTGVFHSAPSIILTRYEFSVKMIKYLEMDHSLINSITNEELGRKIKTGQNKCLDATKLKKLGYKFKTLDESFNIIKKQMKANN